MRWGLLMAGLLVAVGCGPFAAAGTPAGTPAGYSAAGLYDLANSYARAGKPGLAVLNYERARLLAPGDPDIAANERHVRDTVHLRSDAPTPFQQALTRVGPTPLAWIGVLGLLVVGLALIAGRWSDRRRGLRRGAVLVGLAGVAFTVCQGALLWPLLQEGVIVTGATPVLVSPVPMGDPLFVLPEASAVRITAEHEGYVLIRAGDGRTGWVSRTNLIPVVPR